MKSERKIEARGWKEREEDGEEGEKRRSRQKAKIKYVSKKFSLC